MKDQSTVVIVEDEFLIAEMSRYACEEVGVTVVAVCHSAKEGIAAILEHAPDYAIVDVRLNDDIDGVDIARIVNERGSATKIVFATGSTEQRTMVRMTEQQPLGIITKPIDARAIESALQMC